MTGRVNQEIVLFLVRSHALESRSLILSMHSPQGDLLSLVAACDHLLFVGQLHSKTRSKSIDTTISFGCREA